MTGDFEIYRLQFPMESVGGTGTSVTSTGEAPTPNGLRSTSQDGE